MSRSVASRASNASSKMLEELANRSQTKIYRVEGMMNDEEMRVIWNAFGLYINRNLRMGRGVHIPRLGTFTFTPPEVRLKGVTNEEQRDQQPRNPVFLIQKDFIKGVNLKTAIFYHQQFGAGLRPYNTPGVTGEVPITKMNLIEISSYANMPKDATELGINRIIKYITQKLLSGSNISLELPNIGTLICRNHLVAVKFNEFVQRDTRNVLARSVDERKLRGNMSLTSDNLKRLNNVSDMNYKLSGKNEDFFNIDDKAKQFLSTNFNIQVDESNFRRSVTGFDRSVASRAFDKTNKSLKDSHFYRLTQSGFFPTHTCSNKEFNMALRILREWIRDNGFNSKQGYDAFCRLANKKTGVLTASDTWNACKEVSIDITEQQCTQLFRILDSNKDGVITLDDWCRNIHFDHNNHKFKDLISFIKNKKYTAAKILSILGLEGVRKATTITLKQGLVKLWPGVSDQDALLLSKYISKGKDEIQVQRIVDILNVKDDQPAQVDPEWQSRFFARLKRKLVQNHTTEEQLLNKFKLCDKHNIGFIEQTDFKTVLGQLGISLNLTELIKVVKFVPINKQNSLNYEFIIDKVSDVESASKEDLTEEQFRNTMKKLLLGGKAPFAVPISVTKLTNILQSKHFKQFQERDVLKYVRSIDLNEDEQISVQDLNHYREIIAEKTYKDLSALQIDQLLIRLREKSIKKKISFYDLFRKLDKVGSGFITHEGWLKNINEIIPFTYDQKENLFNFMDKSNSKVIDYKTFLSIMNGQNMITQSQKFDWAEQTLNKIKEWYYSSRLTTEDAFKVIDRDGDTYLSEKDLHDFLIDKLKFQERQLGMVRLQKLMKILDCYKHGRISYIDWYKTINENKDWIADVKQQIGIVISKHYPSLSQAFYSISTGDKKMVYSAFEKWVKNNHVLSGFMINQDMLKTIFNQLDHHKKGYILQNDFVGLFGTYNWKSEHFKEFTDFLKLKFSSSDEAFKYMSDYSKKTINYDRFCGVINDFFRNRFQPSDCKGIWKNLSGGKDSLDLSQFNRLHGHLWSRQQNPIDREYPKDGWKYQDFSIIKGTTVRSNEFDYEERQIMEQQCNKFINNLKDIIASSPKTLEQSFTQVDHEKTGKVTNLMFKKAFRILNIALTSKEIDLLLNYCQLQSESLIDWKQFIKKLQLHEDKQKIRTRMQPKIQHISDLLHYYMISPKDAFRKWNNPRTGYLSFEEFHKMMKELYQQASEPLPEFQQLQDIFRFIDIRKDNQLDFQEFTQVFRNCNPPNLLMGTTPAPSDQVISKPSQDKEATLPTPEKSIPKFRHSPIYEEFIKLIGRNRRYIQEEIQKHNSEKAAFIPFSSVQKIVREFAVKHKVNVDSNMIRNLIAFSMTGEKVDYQLLMSKFKDMSIEISEFPKHKVF